MKLNRCQFSRLDFLCTLKCELLRLATYALPSIFRNNCSPTHSLSRTFWILKTRLCGKTIKWNRKKRSDDIFSQQWAIEFFYSNKIRNKRLPERIKNNKSETRLNKLNEKKIERKRQQRVWEGESNQCGNISMIEKRSRGNRKLCTA